MKTIKNLLAALLILAAGNNCHAQILGRLAENDAPSTEQDTRIERIKFTSLGLSRLPRSTPTQEGVDPLAVEHFAQTLMSVPQTDIHHMIIVRHGKVIAEMHPEPFSREEVHTLFSCSKTFTMLAVGMLVDDGKLRVTDRVVDLLPEKCPKKKSSALKNMTVKHLLTMTAGIKPSLTLSMESDDWARDWLAQPVTRQGHFQYDSMCTFLLSAIVQKITGKTLLEFLNERMFSKLGISEADWELSPDGICTGGWGLRLTAESMAKAGLMMLNGGTWKTTWKTERIVSEQWLAEAERAYTNYDTPGDKATDTNQGYCYQMWRCLLPDAFRADGAYGQFIVMSPKYDLVVVINGVSHRTGEELACIWNELIPGMRDVPIFPDEESEQSMRETLAGMELPLIEGRPGRVRDSVTLELGENARNYKTMKITFDKWKDATLTITRTNGAVERHFLRHNEWSAYTTEQAPPYDNGAEIVNRDKIDGIFIKHFNIAGNYAFTDDNTLMMRLYWTNWIVPQTFTITLGENGAASVANDEGYPSYPPRGPQIIPATITSQAPKLLP